MGKGHPAGSLAPSSTSTELPGQLNDLSNPGRGERVTSGLQPPRGVDGKPAIQGKFTVLEVTGRLAG